MTKQLLYVQLMNDSVLQVKITHPFISKSVLKENNQNMGRFLGALSKMISFSLIAV